MVWDLMLVEEGGGGVGGHGVRGKNPRSKKEDANNPRGEEETP